MLYPEFKYVGYKSVLRDYTNIEPLRTDWDLKEDVEHYQSIYRFNEDVRKHAHLADLEDTLLFYADYLVFDFDSTDLSISLADTQHFERGIKALGASPQTYFSGNKGFHVLIPTSQFGFTPTSDEGVLKRMATLLATKFQSFDPSIYNKTRVFRMANTLNAKSGLYKIPLHNIQEMTLADIQAEAKEPADWDFGPAYDHPKCETLIRVYNIAKTKINRAVAPAAIRDVDFKILRDAQEGQRNVTLYHICRAFARRAVFESDMMKIANWWNNSQNKPMDSEEVERTVISAYKKGMNQIVENESVFNHIYPPRKALSEIRTMYANWTGNVFQTGYSFFDDYTMGLFRQEVYFIISRPGNFKTALLSNLLHGVSKASGKPSLFFSMEMGYDQLTQRHIQKAEHLTQRQVMEGLKTGRDFEKYEQEFKNVHVVSLSSLNTDRVLHIMDKYMEEYGELAAIGFDYLSLFEGCANNTERTARMATELKTRIGKAANCPTLCLVQAKQTYEGDEGDIEIDRSAGKDSSSIEDSGDYVIGTWGHWVTRDIIDPVTYEKMGTERFKRLYGAFLKSRKYHFEKFKQNPYFEIDIDRPYMDVKDIIYVPQPPTFNQRKEF